MPTIAHGPRTVHYTQSGSGPGIVLVPGIGAGAAQFGTLPRRFARAGFCCCAVDPPGLPPTDPLPGGGYDFEQAALDVLAVAATLPGPTALCGVSLGGKVALQAAARGSAHADHLVMLCSSALLSPRARFVQRMFARLAADVDGALFGDLLAPLLFGATFLDDRPGAVNGAIRTLTPAAATRALMLAQGAALPACDGERLCRQVALPALCITGAEDVLVPPREVAATAAMIPGAEYECMPAVGHSLLLESGAAFDRVVAFLRR